MGTIDEFKKRIYEIVEASHDGDKASKMYDIMMMVAVVVGMIPLMSKVENHYMRTIDGITGILFFVDYFFRVFTADYKMGIKIYKAYVFYAFTPMAIIDLLSVIPALTLLFPDVAAIGAFRIFRIFLVLKLIRYSKTMTLITNVIRKVKSQLFAVLVLTVIYIFTSAMLMFQMEPDIFNHFFDALYWATVSITTIGYGDISPVTPIGRLITMVSALVGVAVIALPSGIITAAYMDEVKRKKSKHEL
ncbi:MAG: ion transporter [Lachnospiraceae bacterium]|nr:ion transporter [Lachnospiraceae bacterium]